MAYDSSRGVTVLFGGLADQGGALRDTWEWDGQRWTERLPAVSPPATAYHTMAFDSRRGVVVLFSGQGNFSNTWEYDGQTWTLVTQSGPVARVRHKMVYDSHRGVVVLFGGSNGGFRLNDMWEWDGVQWLQAATPLGPAARMDHAMAYDSQRGRVVLFGGLDQNRDPLNDTWELACEPCYPDCDANGVLDFLDFLCFQNAFLAGDPYADCDQNGVFDFFDFLCFQNEFLAGCP